MHRLLMSPLATPLILSMAVGMSFFNPSAAQHSSPPPLMLAQTYHKQAVAGWLASEKLDGVRAYWDGTQLYSRAGNIFHAPPEFTAALPPFAIDGELYLGRGRFQETVSHIKSGNWQAVEFHIFDVPHASGGLSERLASLTTWLKDNPNPRLHIIEQIPLQDFAQAQKLQAAIENAGGEGLILRDPNAPYLATRSAAMLKLKSHDDAECTVIAHLAGKGKHQDKMGALLCRLDNGSIIRIGSGFSDAERQHPPPLNSRITFRFRGYTDKGLPRFATFWRIRPD